MPTRTEGTTLTAEAPAPVRCDYCGAVICVYEPLIVAEHGRCRETSRAAETGLPVVDSTLYHRDCYTSL